MDGTGSLSIEREKKIRSNFIRTVPDRADPIFFSRRSDPDPFFLEEWVQDPDPGHLNPDSNYLTFILIY